MSGAPLPALAVALLALAGTAPPAAAPAPNAPKTAAQFCAFAQQLAGAADKMRGGAAAPNGMRIESVAANCAKRRLTWTESAATALGAHQLAALRQNWNKAMCENAPLRDAVLHGWTLAERVKANGRTYQFEATCRAS